jgi:hypothetical protein
MEIHELKALIKESIREVLREERMLLCQVLIPYVSCLCWEDTSLEILRARGEHTGLRDYIDQIEQRLTLIIIG